MVVLENLESESSFSPLWLYHLSNLDEEDKDIQDLFEYFDGPDEVFPYVLELKDEGNTLFKLKDFGHAYTIYSKAIKSFCIVVSAICDGDACACESNPLFRDLIISLTLNMAACAIKLNNWAEAVECCSLILKADEKNVKALFRKGTALKNLGRLDEAFEDLSKARSLEPKNKEIATEFAELQRVLSHGPMEEDHESTFRSQLHKSLAMQEGQPEIRELMLVNNGQYLHIADEGCDSNIKMESEIKLEYGSSSDSKEVDELNVSDSSEMYDGCKDHTSITNTELLGGVDNWKNNINYPVGLGSGLPPRKVPPKDEVIKDTIMEVKDEVQNTRMEEAEQRCSTSDSSSNITDAETFANQYSDEEISPPNLETSTYQFHNRKKQGASLSISKRNYLFMSKGKALKLYNAKLGSFMEVRIVNKLEKEAANVSDYHIQESANPVLCENHSTLETIKQESSISKEAQSDTGSCVTSEAYQAEVCDDACSSPSSKVSHFVFSAGPKTKTRTRRYEAVQHRSSKHQMKGIKRRKMPTYESILSPNIAYNVCRFDYCRKRKDTHSPLGSSHHPRKKLATLAHNCCSVKSNLSSVDYNGSLVMLCTNNGMELQECSQETGEAVDVSVNKDREN